MLLISKALTERLQQEGLLKKDAMCKQLRLCDWLSAQGIASDTSVITQYFGLPYRELEDTAQIQMVDLPETIKGWEVYYLPMEERYVCTRPPTEKEKSIFRETYGAVDLTLTDAVAVASLLLDSMSPSKNKRLEDRGHYYNTADLLRQGNGHIDGVIGYMMQAAIMAEATDIHLYSTRTSFEITFRVAAQLVPYASLNPEIAEILINKLKLMAEMDIAEHRLPQDGHIELHFKDAVYHLRLGTLPLLNGEKIVIRILPEQQRLSDFTALGFSSAQEEMMHRVMAKHQGLILISGPTNSGKTTTLYTCLQCLIRMGALVYTIEDPVEVVLPQAQQMQVNTRSGFSFAAGLRGILRSDPDVIAIGELRDQETVDIAARAALSGHLVIATIHAYDAHQVVNRLRDLGLSNLLLSAVLSAVINQRLLPKKCETCAGRGIDSEGRCCYSCMGTGQKGRTGIQELWIPSEKERAEIESGMSSFDLRRQTLETDFLSLEKRFLQKKDYIVAEKEAGVV